MIEMCCNCGSGKICDSQALPTDKCSHWTPKLEPEPEKPKEPEHMDDKSRESWLRVGELLVERLKTIKEQQETIEHLKKHNRDLETELLSYVYRYSVPIVW